MPLPTVNSSESCGQSSAGGAAAAAGGLKRSPYLSAMASSSKESEDLVAMLSRPTPSSSGGGHAGTQSSGGVGGMGFGGSSTFFNLKRPSSHAAQTQLHAQFQEQVATTVTPVSSAGSHSQGWDSSADGANSNGAGSNGGVTGDLEGTGAGLALSSATSSSQARLPSLRSALRVGSSLRVSASARGEEESPKANFDAGAMKKNLSVTFSNNTKRASATGIGGNATMEVDGATSTNNMLLQQQQMRQQYFPSRPGQQAPAGPTVIKSNYSAAMMMKKSQSIAAPEFLRAHQSSSSNTGGSNASGGKNEDKDSSGNAQFPIYFAKLDDKNGQGVGGADQGVASGSDGAPASPPQHGYDQNDKPPSPGSPSHRRQKSKSVNSLQYYARNALPSGQDPGYAMLNAVNMASSRPSKNRLNLTFREMLDEGDGKEGDLNIKTRNQQWKDFRMFSNQFGSNNGATSMGGQDSQQKSMMMNSLAEKMASVMSEKKGNSVHPAPTETDNDGTILEKNESSDASEDAEELPNETTADASMGDPTSLSGSKRTLTPTAMMTQESTSGPKNGPSQDFGYNMGASMGNPQMRQHVFGSHRAAVSVNDLAMLRRSAARSAARLQGLTNNPSPAGGAATGNWGTGSMPSAPSTPGATLGGDMLSRISSSSSTAADDSNPAKPLSNQTNFSSPLAQMMAAKSTNLTPQQQQELLLMKAKLGNMTMATGIGNNNGGMNRMGSVSGLGMGRRSRTVGAGLAYGGAHCHTVQTNASSRVMGNVTGVGGMEGVDGGQRGVRLSRFDLGALGSNSRLSITSGYDRQSSGGASKNEDWGC